MDRRSKFAVWVLAGAAALLLTMRSMELQGQDQTPAAAQPHPPAIKAVILLDPGHGGTDPGADLGNKISEKEITLALATKLRDLLTAQGFSVVLTRDSGAGDTINAQQRAETANRVRALACVSLHATRSSSGVHVYTSALQPSSENPDSFMPTRWETAQEGFVTQSAQLAGDLKTAFGAAGLPTSTGTATVPPLDSMTCPAVAIEFAPLNTLQVAGQGIDDPRYQESAVRAIAAALVKWRTDTAPPPPPVKVTP